MKQKLCMHCAVGNLRPDKIPCDLCGAIMGEFPNTKNISRRRRVDQAVATTAKEMRAHKNKTLQDVAAHLGLSYQQVQKYESGGNRISAGTLLILCDFYEIPISYFYGRVRSELT